MEYSLKNMSDKKGIHQESNTELPVGYRFIPTDAELLYHYLKNKVLGLPLPCDKIKEVNVYRFNPEELRDEYRCEDEELYFFTPREKKYKNGSRPNRAAGGGYWKATGSDKVIKYTGVVVGVKKALVYYRGNPKTSVKTNWIMYEFRVPENTTPDRPQRDSKDMTLDDCVLCQIHYNGKGAKKAPKRPSLRTESNENSSFVDGSNGMPPTPQLVVNSNANYLFIQKNNTQELNDCNGMLPTPQPGLNSNANCPFIQKNNTQELNDYNGMPPTPQPALNSNANCPFIQKNKTQELNDCNGMPLIPQSVLNSMENCPFNREINTEQTDVPGYYLDNELYLSEDELFHIFCSPSNDLMMMNFKPNGDSLAAEPISFDSSHCKMDQRLSNTENFSEFNIENFDFSPQVMGIPENFCWGECSSPPSKDEVTDTNQKMAMEENVPWLLQTVSSLNYAEPIKDEVADRKQKSVMEENVPTKLKRRRCD